MPRTLILGGTRNLGHVAALRLLESGHDVTILNRGHTRDDLPKDIERLRADRADDASVRSAIGNRSFDLVLDNTTYTESDAKQAVSVFGDKTGQYVFISSGQVYLVREHIERPFRERDYSGPVMPAPAHDSPDHPSWLYGIEKRLAEDVFSEASSDGFPVITLRLPMVASERDHYGRIQGYIARLMDGYPLLIPEGHGLPLRHVYVDDVASLVTRMASMHLTPGAAYNISFGESLALDDFLSLLSTLVDPSPEIRKVKRDKLIEAGLLPDCSPFSGKWMSELDNTLSVSELKAEYTSPAVYLPSIVEDYRRRWIGSGLVPDSYRQREKEVIFAR
jgi:nucleoside-diphosphate-sugar epimerase